MIFSFLQRRPREYKIKPIVLLILDGYGVAPAGPGNAIEQAKRPNMATYTKVYPNTTLIASGEAVGLPANEVGNTEVGHLTMGAGRVIYQDLKRISMSIEDGTFFSNDAFLNAYQHTQKYNSSLHIMGLIGSGNVHSSTSHLYALLEFCRSQRMRNVYLHLFTDGRDSPPTEALKIVTEIQQRLDAMKIGKIATISGRYFAMDRDRRWDRTEKAYKAIVEGIGMNVSSAEGALKNSYANNATDEFVLPTVIVEDGKPTATISDNDSVIFYNFRIDRPRQLTMAMVLPNFETLSSFEFGYVSDQEKVEGNVNLGKTFVRNKVPKNLYFVSMTEYQKNLPVSAIAFPPLVVTDSLSSILSSHGMKQMHMSESEKERFVTYYFDGLRENPVLGEDRSIVPSPKVATYDRRPQMSVFDIVRDFKKQIWKDYYNFFVINFANADMVGHTGNIKAAIKAIEYEDNAIGQVKEEIIKAGGTLLITADHGNAEQMLAYSTSSYFFTTAKGEFKTDHTNNPVPLIIIRSGLENSQIKIPNGALSDVAPTVLGLMGINKPEDMTGRNLLKL